jgi:hypothetical protein
MGRGGFTKVINYFIMDIPDHKLEGGIASGQTVYKTTDLRLDCQNTFKGRDGRHYHNLQIQANKGCTHTTGSRLVPDTVAMCHAPVNHSWSASRIQQELLATVTGGELGRDARPRRR